MILELYTFICLIALGVVIGMYTSSQIENHINKRTKK
jgi:uncharacterized membrane protein